MSSATLIVSSVRDVLLKTSAPYGSRSCTAMRASGPEATTVALTPLRVRAALVRASWSGDASRANSVTTASEGGASGRDPAVSVTIQFREPSMHERDRHRALADRGRATLDRPAAHVAGREETR